jgi:ketosteroid isomerase-like protein
LDIYARGLTMPRNREIVEQFYERFNDGDLDAAMAVVADDLEMTAPGMETVTGSAHRRGPIQRHLPGGRDRTRDRSAVR